MSLVEAAAAGINWTFAPMVDVARDPRWGRVAESFGEDPYLCSKLGVAMVDGFQRDDLSDPGSIAACAKHFAGYGAVESGRDYATTSIPEIELRNVHLPPFRATIDAGVATLQAPVAAADLWWLVSQPARPAAAAKPAARPLSRPAEEPAPRLFSAGQLTRLAEHSSTVACECPAHLVQLVQGLNAFERYSADCENTSPDDAALHAYLHHETGRARAIMEAALARLAEAEAIEY